jgi:hypothetical protein
MESRASHKLGKCSATKPTPHSTAITLYQELSTNIEKKILGLRGKGLEKHVRGFAFDLQHQTKQNI